MWNIRKQFVNKYFIDQVEIYNNETIFMQGTETFFLQIRINLETN